METSQHLNDFISTLIDLMDGLSVIPQIKQSIIFQNIGLVQNSINSNKQKVIEQFIIHVLPFKTEIDNGNDEFFLNHDYSNKNNVDKNGLEQIFQFKSVWKTLSDENKDTIKDYMKILCYCSNEYFKIVYINK